MITNISLAHSFIREFLQDNFSFGILARGASRLLRLELSKLGVEFFDISWRLKSLPSTIEKVNRLSCKDLSEIKDRAGVRIICLYNHDVDEVLAHVERLFNIQSIEDTLSRQALSSFGYSSKHCILKWRDNFSGPADFNDLPEFMRLNTNDEPVSGELKEKLDRMVLSVNTKVKKVCFELQVRTILQHAWASVSHEIIYKREPEIPEKTHRRLARLSAFLEEVDEGFSEASENSPSKAQPLTFPELSKKSVDSDYLKQYSFDVLQLDLSSEDAQSALKYLSTMNVKNISDFEDLMSSTIEALQLASCDVLLPPLRGLGLWSYLNTIAYWANCSESLFMQIQRDQVDLYRKYVHEEKFQQVLRRVRLEKEL